MRLAAAAGRLPRRLPGHLRDDGRRARRVRGDGLTYADRVESRCEVLELDYLFGSMGEFEYLPPIRGRPGETLRNNGEDVRCAS